jgi:hypothetical protein
MYLDNLFGASSYLSPYQWGASTSANANAINSADTAPVISAQAPTAVGAANLNSDQVNLSNAARALQTQNGGSANPQAGAPTDFSQEQQMLTALTDKSLAALGIISPADEANTKISFDSLSYQVSSSATASIGQQGQQTTAAVAAEQDASFDGQGTIVTPDGKHYTFQISLELDQSAQAASTVGNNANNSNPSANAGGAAGALGGSTTVDNTTQQQPSNLLAQLVNAIGVPSASVANSSDPQNSNPNSPAGNANGLALQADQSGSSTGINWDAIIKQTASLFDLLDSLAIPKPASGQIADHLPAQSSKQASTQVQEQTPVTA